MYNQQLRKISCLLALVFAVEHSGSFFASALSTLTPNQHQLNPILLGRTFVSTGNNYDHALRSSGASHLSRKQSAKSNRARTIQLSASPSGIDTLPQIAQAGVFFGVYLSLALATAPATKVLEVVSKSVIGLEKWRENVIDTTLPLLMGLLYLTAGIGHFTNSHAFQDIYPPTGTWGIWYLPGSAEFHVAWTGVVEILGGSGLMLSAARSILASEEDDDESLAINLIKPISALTLFVLTVLVTPANTYMYTHGATMGDMPPLDLSFHYVRFAVQVAFLSLLITLARDSFFFAWGDELD